MLNSRFFPLLVFVLALFAACKKDDNPASGGGSPTNSFTVNGAGYNNRTFIVPASLNVPQFPLPSPAIGTYVPQDSATVCYQLVAVVSFDSIRTGCLLGFLGNRTGTYQSASRAAGFELYVEGRKFLGGYDGQTLYSGTSATINVTRYDPVGGRIQGAYSGTLREEVNGALTNTTITLTGNFDVLHISNPGGGNRSLSLGQTTQAE
ncbi:MAG: hypothetical protein NZM06_11970 [Chloroherpetonaceae bacterium]|nr:hypothetical protein [Chloroherpetonaceae bacterium]MDW8438715.1 hypothetical protein [Chloroherpetonaceae bacterium]